MSLHDLIRDADDTVHEDHPVPEWGDVKVRVRGLTGTQRDAYEATMMTVRDGKNVEMHLQNFRARLLVKCLCDPETGERIFKDAEVGVLGSKSAVVLERLHTVACRLSGLDDDAPARAEGNSGADLSAGSTTG